jgi:hypothetical protein
MSIMIKGCVNLASCSCESNFSIVIYRYDVTVGH